LNYSARKENEEILESFIGEMINVHFGNEEKSAMSFRGVLGRMEGPFWVLRTERQIHHGPNNQVHVLPMSEVIFKAEDVCVLSRFLETEEMAIEAAKKEMANRNLIQTPFSDKRSRIQ